MDSFDNHEEYFRELDKAGDQLQYELSELMYLHQQALSFYQEQVNTPGVDLQHLAADIQASEEFMGRVGPYAALLHRGKRISEANRRNGIS